MSKTLVVAEVYEGEYRNTTLHAVAAARAYKEATGTDYDIIVLGNGDSVQAAVGGLKDQGAGKILVADDASLAHYLARPYSATIAEAAKAGGYDTVMMTATTMGKDLCPCIAARLDAGMASDIAEVVDAKTFKRPVYAGNAIATVELAEGTKVLSVRATAFDKAEPAGGESATEDVSAAAIDAKAEYTEFEGAGGGGDRPPLADAGIVVSGGRGTKGDFEPIYQLADALNAAVGASRAVCDAGWVPNDWQVGQTGKVVAPDLYFAVGISGAIQHWAGMKDSKTIVAINKDPEAPIMELADYAIVADLFNAAPELTEKLAKLKDAGEISV